MVHDDIKNILENHTGNKNSITSKEIAKIIGITEDDTHSKTRRLIFECAKKFRLPLAATNKGYFLIQTNEEYDEYIANLDERIEGIECRKKFVSDNYRRKNK